MRKPLGLALVGVQTGDRKDETVFMTHEVGGWGWGVSQITPSSWWSGLLLGFVSLYAISIKKKVHLLTKRKVEGWSDDSAEAE